MLEEVAMPVQERVEPEIESGNEVKLTPPLVVDVATQAGAPLVQPRTYPGEDAVP